MPKQDRKTSTHEVVASQKIMSCWCKCQNCIIYACLPCCASDEDTKKVLKMIVRNDCCSYRSYRSRQPGVLRVIIGGNEKRLPLQWPFCWCNVCRKTSNHVEHACKCWDQQEMSGEFVWLQSTCWVGQTRGGRAVLVLMFHSARGMIMKTEHDRYKKWSCCEDCCY